MVEIEHSKWFDENSITIYKYDIPFSPPLTLVVRRLFSNWTHRKFSNETIFHWNGDDIFADKMKSNGWLNCQKRQIKMVFVEMESKSNVDCELDHFRCLSFCSKVSTVHVLAILQHLCHHSLYGTITNHHEYRWCTHDSLVHLIFLVSFNVIQHTLNVNKMHSTQALFVTSYFVSLSLSMFVVWSSLPMESDKSNHTLNDWSPTTRPIPFQLDIGISGRKSKRIVNSGPSTASSASKMHASMQFFFRSFFRHSN